ncbi:macro domain-containing protein [Schlesneria paludicola]|uniref:macro domain-containing protein n=1 Tax=Schlesneria paludicola TaxID=360056 RepID=UPI00058F29E8|nr:macro domain-containing protein [Schlesneria paludicola]
MKVQFGASRLELVQDDITRQIVDAIVNAANTDLAGGGGVDGAIHRIAGPSVMEETRIRYPLGCPAGDAVVSSAGELRAKFIFHAVGPVWRGGQQRETELLRSCFRRCLELAEKHECDSIAFPAISTGVYRFPVDLAAENSLDEIRKSFTTLVRPKLVRMVLFDAGIYGAFARVLESFVIG